MECSTESWTSKAIIIIDGLLFIALFYVPSAFLERIDY